MQKATVQCLGVNKRLRMSTQERGGETEVERGVGDRVR